MSVPGGPQPGRSDPERRVPVHLDPLAPPGHLVTNPGTLQQVLTHPGPGESVRVVDEIVAVDVVHVDTAAPGIRIHVFLTRDRATFYVDTSGEPPFTGASGLEVTRMTLSSLTLRSNWQPTPQ